MSIKQQTRKRLERMGRGALDVVFDYAKRLPWVRERIAAEYDKVVAELRASARPYKDIAPTWRTLPPRGRAADEILGEMKGLRDAEVERWADGYVSGAVYHGGEEHVALLDRAYGLFSQANPLHADIWPSVVKFEAEIVAMAGAMLGGDNVARHGGGEGEPCGVVTSGGTESILLAMKTYRDWARAEKGITSPQIVMPTTAHVAFDKAAQYFGIEAVRVDVGADLRADVAATKRAIGRNTVCVVGSAPAFPHGQIDPIAELSELARERGIGFHTDACLGGFVLPFARDIGHPVPDFDFRLPGVTSISADTHKYGYAAKGTSVLLWRSKALRRHQFFAATEWPGGMYCSPTLAGSRPGALSAACWAAMMAMGQDGYRDATRRILETAATIRRGIAGIRGLRVLGDPLWVVAFASDEIDIYRVLDAMSHRDWNLNGLHKPACVHIAVTLRHTEAGVAERFLADLRESVEHVRAHPEQSGGMAPVYGMAGTLPVRGVVDDLLRAYLEVLYET